MSTPASPNRGLNQPISRKINNMDLKSHQKYMVNKKPGEC